MAISTQVTGPVHAPGLLRLHQLVARRRPRRADDASGLLLRRPGADAASTSSRTSGTTGSRASRPRWTCPGSPARSATSRRAPPATAVRFVERGCNYSTVELASTGGGVHDLQVERVPRRVGMADEYDEQGSGGGGAGRPLHRGVEGVGPRAPRPDQGLSRRDVAVDDVNLTIEHGEYVVLLGPSGCGKTTTLRMIGGHEIPTSGEILLDGESLLGLTPTSGRRRPCSSTSRCSRTRPCSTTCEFGLKMHGDAEGRAARAARSRRSRWSA